MIFKYGIICSGMSARLCIFVQLFVGKSTGNFIRVGHALPRQFLNKLLEMYVLRPVVATCGCHRLNRSFLNRELASGGDGISCQKARMMERAWNSYIGA